MAGRSHTSRGKPAGSGRRKGTPNKSTYKAREVLAKHAPDWDPLIWHIQVARGEVEVGGKPATLTERLSAADKVLRRTYPEMKALDIVSSIEGSIEIKWQE